MGRIFGTDGVRGVANRDLTPEVALRLAEAGATVLAGLDVASLARRPLAVVGRDPRASGEFLEAAVVAGLAATGIDVHRLGVLPTPGVAYLTGALDADFGVMISASHNPMPDNGIKFFARGGTKLEDDIEDQIESAYLGEPRLRPTGSAVGRVVDDAQAAERYVAHLTSTLATSLDGVRVVLDCAEGAASITAPQAFRAAGAEVIAIHDQPNGLNINDNCGSTHLADLQAAVVAAGADAGFALDGDADRCLAVDADGNDVDGDQILAILALAMRDAGQLKDDTMVATVMSNLGFLIAMREAGIEVIRAQVGDRYVLEEMRTGGYSLGGEQSGHVILSEHATTGDGVLSALQVAARMASTGRSLADLASPVRRLPQVLVNVSGVDKSAAATDEVISDAVGWAQDELGETGRVLLRPSGTEALIRVMVEAETEQRAHEIADRLAAVVKAQAALA